MFISLYGKRFLIRDTLQRDEGEGQERRRIATAGGRKTGLSSDSTITKRTAPAATGRAVLVASVSLLLIAVAVTNPGYASALLTATHLLSFGEFGSIDGQFKNPFGVSVDPSNGNIVVADQLNNRIQVFDSDGNHVLSFGTEGSGDGQFNIPRGLAVDPSNGNIVVADQLNHRIQVFDSNGTFVTSFGELGTDDGRFINPLGVSVDPNSGNIVVADSGNHRIQVFDSNGTFVTSFGTEGSGDGQFDNPLGVSVDGSGNIVVADSGNHRIQVFDSNGTFVTSFGELGTDDGEFSGPAGVTVDPSSGNIVVADTGNDRIQVFDSDGNHLLSFGEFGTDDGQFSFPAGVAVDGSSGNMLVADNLNHRIQVFQVQDNQPPAADAGADQDVNEGDLVMLDGTGSTDSDGAVVSYAWTQTAGPVVALDDDTSATPSFTAPQVASDTTLTFELVVTDDLGQGSAADTVDVIVRNVPATISDIQQAIDEMDLDKKVANPLQAPLKQANKILDDGNPDNDSAACGKLDEFLATVDEKELAGQLTAEQALELAEMADEAKAGLDCE